MARQRAVRVAAVSWLRSKVRPLAALVSGLFRGPAVRAVKVAIAAELRADNNVTKLVPREQIYRSRAHHASGAAEPSS